MYTNVYIRCQKYILSFINVQSINLKDCVFVNKFMYRISGKANNIHITWRIRFVLGKFRITFIITIVAVYNLQSCQWIFSDYSG